MVAPACAGVMPAVKVLETSTGVAAAAPRVMRPARVGTTVVAAAA